MNAENLLLTHFSQRYPKIAIMNATSSIPANIDPSVAPTQSPLTPLHPGPIVGLAFDCASIPIGSMWKLSRYTPALEQLFAEAASDPAEEEDLALVAAAMDIPAAELTGATPASGSANVEVSTIRKEKPNKKRKRNAG